MAKSTEFEISEEARQEIEEVNRKEAELWKQIKVQQKIRFSILEDANCFDRDDLLRKLERLLDGPLTLKEQIERIDKSLKEDASALDMLLTGWHEINERIASQIGWRQPFSSKWHVFYGKLSKLIAAWVDSSPQLAGVINSTCFLKCSVLLPSFHDSDYPADSLERKSEKWLDETNETIASIDRIAISLLLHDGVSEKSKKTINDKLLDLWKNYPETREFNQKQLAAELGCGRNSIGNSENYKMRRDLKANKRPKEVSLDDLEFEPEA